MRKRRVKALGAAVAAAALGPLTAKAATITVDSTADNLTDDGQCTLREALANANDDSLTHDDCAFAGSGSDTIDFSLAFPATITLGGTQLAINTPLTIDGPGVTDLTIDGDAASRIFEITDDSSTLIDVAIHDLTLTNGDATVESFTSGGAILNAENLTLTNVTVDANTADFGGGVSHDTGLLTIVDSTFSGNSAGVGGSGGAVFSLYGGDIDVTGSTFTMNSADCCGGAIAQRSGEFTMAGSEVTLNDASYGGGISLYYSEAVTITANTTISSNTATIGGGLYLYGVPGNVLIENSVITGNSAAYAGGAFLADLYGTTIIRDTAISENEAYDSLYSGSSGGLYLRDVYDATLERVRLVDNTAAQDNAGGAILGSRVTITESQITGNSAGDDAGGLYVASSGEGSSSTPSYLNLINSTIANNTASSGRAGGLGIDASFVYIDVSTISGNSAPNGIGGNVAFYAYYSIGSVDINNSIVANGTAQIAPDLYTNVEIDVNYTLVEDPTGAIFTGTNNLTGVDPQLGSLQDNGGPTETMKPANTSPAVNAGDPAFTTPPNDQRGFTRPIGIVDMGAVEINPGTLALSLSSYSVNEAAGTITVTVNRTGGTDGQVTVDYTTSSGTAIEGTDFTDATGMLTWLDGDAAPKTFNVPITNDPIFEGNETFNVTLSNPTGNASLGTSAAIVTILDDDLQPTISISDGGAVENSGPAQFLVTLSNPTTQTVTVTFATGGGTALSGTDFTPNSGTVTFNPLDVSETINVALLDDPLDEPNENFTVTLSNPANGSILDGTADGTILDDDGQPALSIDSVSLPEGNIGTTSFTFTVTLAPSSGQTVTVNYTTQDGSATVAGTDYATNSGTLTFNPGDTSETITVLVNGDTTIEPVETFTVVLSGAAQATISQGTGTGTIQNDDIAPSTADLSVTKVLNGTPPLTAGNNATFTITVSNAGPGTATNVHVLDTIPAGTSFVSATPSAGTCTGTITVDCNVGTLANGGSATITLTVRLDSTGTITNTATASSDLADPSPASGSATFAVIAPAASPIPTASEWMLVVLASALAAAAALKLRS